MHALLWRLRQSRYRGQSDDHFDYRGAIPISDTHTSL
jgi:hypothetical protein